MSNNKVDIISINKVKIADRNVDNSLSIRENLSKIGLYPLRPFSLEILQINMGYMCNQTCTHCHVDAGPTRTEIMTKGIMEKCLEFVKKSPVKTVDLTGGAPEMNPNFKWFVQEIKKLNKEVIVRSNLTILVSNDRFREFPRFFKENKVVIISSMPCYTRENVDKQRGTGVFHKSLEALRILNQLGYGKKETGLELNLVYNPGGAFLPGNQEALEADYKKILWEDYKIEFNKLFTITNLPVNRFLNYLLQSGKYEKYMQTLANAFNPSAAMGVMCRNTLSVGWDGYLYDCDFNQMLNLKVNHKQNHISELSNIEKRQIVIDSHCFGCMAGEGSSCQGAIVNN